LFDRAVLRDKNLIVLSDAEKMSVEMTRLLKTLLGRDLVRYDIKNLQTEGTFVSGAVVLATSNLPFNEAMYHESDLGLLDRFIELPFPICSS
jgi:phage/plasmid-associated DNA primase